MSKPNMLDTIIAAQKDKNPSASISKSSIEDALANVDTMSAADFKKLLAGESIQPATAAPANNIIDIAQDIKKLSENSEIQVVNDHTVTEIIDKTHDNIEQIASNIESLNDIQEQTSLTREERAEENKLMEEEVDLLKRIEDNTRPKGVVPSTSYETGDQSSSLMSGMMGFLGGGLAGAIGGLGTGLAGGGILAALTGGITKFISKLFMGLLKGTVITMLIGGIASGLIDGLEEYKKSGDLVEAIWEGLKGFTEFISFGLISKEDMDKLRDYVTDQWKVFEKTLMDFIDSITPDFMKSKKTESTSNVNIAQRITANDGQELSTLDIKSTMAVGGGEKKDVQITGREIKNTAGENIFSVNIDGQEYRISKETYNQAKELAESGQKSKAIAIIKSSYKEESEQIQKKDPAKRIGDFNVNESAQMNIDMFGNVLTPSAKSNADAVINQTEENTKMKEDNSNKSTPVVVNAPTTNTSMSHTTAMPPVKARPDNTPNLINSYSFP